MGEARVCVCLGDVGPAAKLVTSLEYTLIKCDSVHQRPAVRGAREKTGQKRTCAENKRNDPFTQTCRIKWQLTHFTQTTHLFVTTQSAESRDSNTSNPTQNFRHRAPKPPKKNYTQFFFRNFRFFRFFSKNIIFIEKTSFFDQKNDFFEKSKNSEISIFFRNFDFSAPNFPELFSETRTRRRKRRNDA